MILWLKAATQRAARRRTEMSRLVKVRMTPGKTELALWDQEPAGMLLAALGASIASAWWLPLEVVVEPLDS